ncbi:MAG: phosphoglycerate dehydrogenase [Burkholderiales bacterium]|nr:phosphoglycerate dehydrogenase [Phycisphaerae bacterium]
MNTQWNVLVTAPYMIPFMNRFTPVLESEGCRVIVPPVFERLEENQLLELVGNIDGTICGDDRYTRRVLEAATRMKIISKWGTGIDSIDRAGCDELGIRIGNTPNAFSVPVADSVFAYMLSFARQTPWMDQQMKAGRWEKIAGKSLSECTIGIVGVGNIGKEVARRAASFGMTVLGNDVRELDRSFLAVAQMEPCKLNDLLARSDFVTLHTDLNPSSHHLMSTKQFAMMKPSAVLINTSRGPIVDEPALVAALKTKQIAGAGLDVFEVEPLPDSSPLKQMSNVLLAPHNSNSSPAAWERVHQSSIRNLLSGLREVKRGERRAA